MEHSFTEAEIAAVKGIRQKPTGSWEAAVFHPTLPKSGKSRSFSDERTARIWKLTEHKRLTAEYEATAIATGLVDADPRLVALHGSRPRSMRDVLLGFADHERGAQSYNAGVQARILANEPVMAVDAASIKAQWIEALLSSYKKERLKPATIAKKVGLLRAAIKWWHHEYWLQCGLERPVNPFDDMRNGFNKYAAKDPKRVEDGQRDRRLLPGEEQAILDVIEGRTRRRCNRPVNNPVETRMLFLLIVNTGLRLREAYRLRMRAVDMSNDLITVEESKLTRDGRRLEGMRRVPMTIELHGWLSEYIAAKGLQAGSDEPLFKLWWKGQTDEDDLKLISGKLSQMFAAIFADAGCEDLREHDLRHEATSRWCEMKLPNGQRMYDMLHVMKFTGHTSQKTFMRYLRYFEQDLTPRRMLEAVA